MIKKDIQTESKADKNDKTKEKAPYSSPHLMTYGDIRELTQHASNTTTPKNDRAPAANIPHFTF